MVSVKYPVSAVLLVLVLSSIVPLVATDGSDASGSGWLVSECNGMSVRYTDGETVLYVSLFDNPGGVSDITVSIDGKNLKGQGQEFGVNTVLTAPTDVEVGSPLADKGQALTALANKLGISRRQILAIGDNDNDLGMLRAAGTAVAMGNATESVKAMADFTAPSNNEDGVASVLEALE